MQYPCGYAFLHVIPFSDTTTKDVAHILPSGPESVDALRKKKKKRIASPEEVDAEADEQFEQAISAVPYDPTEPLYCACRRVSFGDMIGCENSECKIEWFHFRCVGIKAEVSVFVLFLY